MDGKGFGSEMEAGDDIFDGINARGDGVELDKGFHRLGRSCRGHGRDRGSVEVSRGVRKEREAIVDERKGHLR